MVRNGFRNHPQYVLVAGAISSLGMSQKEIPLKEATRDGLWGSCPHFLLKTSKFRPLSGEGTLRGLKPQQRNLALVDLNTRQDKRYMQKQ